MSSPQRVFRSVWKFPMSAPVERLALPADARVLNVDTQGGIPTMWVLVTLDVPLVTREFIAFGTGHLIPHDDRHTYVGTAHNVEGVGLVFHIFERTMP